MKKVLNILSPFKVILLFLILFFFSLSQIYAAEITLEWDPWDPNAQPDVAGYKFYFDTNSGHPYYECDYTNIKWSVDGGNTWYPIPDPPPIIVGTGVAEISLRNLDSNETYYFAVKAYDDQGRESVYSNQVTTFGITSPQDGFYVNASNYTSYTISGMGIAGASVDVFAGSTLLKTTTVFSYGTWEINVNFTNFPSIAEGPLSLTAVSGGITSSAVAGTFDKTASSSSANSLSYASGTFSLTWTAYDATSGLDFTELWYKKSAGGSWTPTGETQTGTGGTISYSPITPIEADTYYFATQATDKAGNVEEDPSGDGDISIEVSGGGGGTDKAAGGGCFIATTAFGSNMDRHVKILTKFRDKRLVTNSIGRGILHAYHKFSPPVASYLHKRPFTRAVVRYALIPITGIAYVSLYINPLALLFAFILLLLTGIYCARRLPRSRGNLAQ